MRNNKNLITSRVGGGGGEMFSRVYKSERLGLE